MTWNGQRIFITGADGFIGSHLAEKLCTLGADVTAMAQYNSWSRYGWLESSPTRGDMNLVHGDVRDPDQMTKLLREQSVVFHLAALMSVPHSTEAPSSYLYTNVMGTQNVLRGAQDAHRIVITSTSEVYGTAQSVPISEEHPIVPQSPYAASKVAADALAVAYQHTYRSPCVILRPFNTYGPRQSERAVIPTIIRQAVDDRCKTVQLGSLIPKRDLTYIDDTVEAFIKVAQHDNPVTIGEIYNCGCGKSVSVGGLAELIISGIGNVKPIVNDPERMRSNDVYHLEADSSKIFQDVGWEPQVSLDDGLKATAKWWKQRMGDLKQEAKYVI